MYANNYNFSDSPVAICPKAQITLYHLLQHIILIYLQVGVKLLYKKQIILVLFCKLNFQSLSGLLLPLESTHTKLLNYSEFLLTPLNKAAISHDIKELRRKRMDIFLLPFEIKPSSLCTTDEV